MTGIKKILAILLAAGLALSLTACKGKDDPISPDGDKVVAGGGKLVIALPSEPVGLVGSQVGTLVSNTPICNIAEGLMTVTPDGSYEPLLAESYEVVDELTYRFHLKKGVKFHNGEEMKASDVVYSLKAAAESPKVKHAAAQLEATGIVAEDEYTVLVKTVIPYSPILACLSHSANSIVSEKAWREKGDDFIRNPVGTGPFEFVSWTSGERIVLKRFENYHGEKAQCEELIFRIMTEAASRTIELESGGVDVIGDIPANDIKRFAASPDKFTIYKKPGMRIYPVIMNQQSEIFKNKLVRQALSHATNTADIIHVVWSGAATQVSSVMPPSVMGYTDNVTQYAYDEAKAKQLLSEAGYPTGFTCTLITSEASENVKIAEMVQAQWAKVGVTVKIEQLENAAWLTRQNNLNFDISVCPTNNSVGDPDANFTKMFHSANIGPAGNFAAYKSDEVDKLIKEAGSVTHEDQRLALYATIQKLITEDAVWITVGVPDLQVATSSALKGFALYANNTQRYRTVSK